MGLTRRQLLMFSLTALPVAARGVLDWQRENLLIADSLQRSKDAAHLLALNPVVARSGRVFHSYPVIDQALLSPGDRSELIQALVRALKDYSIRDGVSGCFRPRHGLRLGTQDVLISFECNQLYFYGKGRPLLGRLRGGEVAFRRVARGLRLE